MSQTFSLAGQNVLITGAGRGLGWRMAHECVRRGARAIIAWDIDDSALAELAQSLSHSGVLVHTHQVDVTDPAAVRVAVDSAEAELDRIDVLINNAGVVSGQRLLELDDSDIHKTFGVNTLSLYWTTRAVLPGMLARNHGRIVTIASAAGLAGPSRQTDYAASKHAAVGFTESLRAELRQARSAVSCLTVCPFYVNTGMFDGVATKNPLLPLQDQDRVARRIVSGIESRARELLIPRTVYLVRVLRLLPTRWFDQIADWFGINESMANFTGRTPDAQKSRARGGT